MNKNLFSTIALMSLSLASTNAQDIKGEVPQAGESYLIYNMAQKQGIEVDGAAAMLGEATKLGLEKGSADGLFNITASGKKLSSDLWTTPTFNNDGTYTDWILSPVDGKENVYTIACRNREASNAFYLYYSEVSESIALTAQKPGDSFENAHWMFAEEQENGIECIKTIDGNTTNGNIATGKKGVYTIDGKKVDSTKAGADKLGKGVYIIDGRKTAK